MFNGRFAKHDTIFGELMDARAHRGNGYRGYAWTKAEITIVDADHLALSGGINLKSNGELGANMLCDRVKYINLPNGAAYTFNYANKDLEPKNYRNAACWLYISASQRHHEAQRELALPLPFWNRRQERR